VLLRARVELLAKLHDVDALRTQRGSDRGGWRRFAAFALELDDRLDLLHGETSSTDSEQWRSSRSRCTRDELDLRKIHLNGRRPPEDGNRHFDFALVEVDVLDFAGEVRERPAAHANLIADVVDDVGIGRLLLDVLGSGLAERTLHLRRGHRFGVLAAEEASHLGGVGDDVPTLLVQLHVDEDVPREELAAGLELLLAAPLRDLLGGDEDLAELLLVGRALDPVLERSFDTVLVPRERLDDVPLHRLNPVE